MFPSLCGSRARAARRLQVVFMILAGVVSATPSLTFAQEPGTPSVVPPTTPPPEDPGKTAPAEEVYADLVLLNGRIWTGSSRLAAVAEPTALASSMGLIVAIGNDEGLRKLIGPKTEVIDAGGRRVIPGITDSHVHLIDGGLHLARLNLRDVKGRAEFVRAVEEEAKKKAPGEWVLGGRWSVESWAQREAPHRAWLDPVTGDRPALLSRMDGHQALVNSAALKLAGIDDKGPPDPKGGEIERDPRTGEPTGVLKDAAIGLVARHQPVISAKERDEALGRAMREMNSFGVTSVHDMADLADLDVYRRAATDGSLTLRVHVFVSVSDWPKYIQQVKAFTAPGDMVTVRGFKGFMDGSLGSRTAYMREPFADAAPTAAHPRGLLDAMADPFESFAESHVKVVDAANLQMAVHAIGDEANHLILDSYEAARKASGRTDARHRVEHAQHLLPEDIARFAKLGVVASLQPYHKADDGRYAPEALGPRRSATSYAFRPLVKAGAVVAFGSDWPVVTCDPFAGIDAAVTSRILGPDGRLSGGPWVAENSLTVEEALRAYTSAPAWAVHDEDRSGALDTAKRADFVVLSADPLTIPPERLSEVRAVRTVVGGKTVFTRPE